MEPLNQLYHPSTFERHSEYFFVDRRDNGHEPVFTPVRFYAYDACPAFIIVRTQRGNRWRCPRDGLFIRTSHSQ